MNAKAAYPAIGAGLIVAFFAGRWTGDREPDTARAKQATPAAAMAPGPAGASKSPVRPAKVTEAPRKTRFLEGVVSKEEAAQLTRAQRLALVRQGSLIFDGLRQAEFLSGVIPALDNEEVKEAIGILGAAQGRGNFAAQAVWDEVWRQCGRLDPAGWLADMTANPGKTRSDARHLMEGWFETNPAAAAEWAQQPGKSGMEAQAAAALLSWKSGGDLQQLQASLLALPPGDAVRKEVLLDYLDLSAATGKGDAAAAYDGLPQELKADGWSATMQQLTFGDPQQAVDWLTAHAGEPGTNYNSIARLVRDLAKDDPAAAAAWVARLPEVQGGSNFHPAALAFSEWRRKDAGAAIAWLTAQPANLGWANELRAQYLPPQ